MMRPPPALGSRHPGDLFDLLREAGRAAGLGQARPAGAVPGHDDVGRRPARRLLRDRRAQGRLRVDRRRRRVGRPAHARARRTTCSTTSSASSTASAARGATCAAAWARSPRRSPPAPAPPARSSAPARPCSSIDVRGRRRQRRHARGRRGDPRPDWCSRARTRAGRCSTWSGAEHFPDEVAEDMRRYSTRGGSVKINAVLSEPPRYERVDDERSAALLHTSLAIARRSTTSSAPGRTRRAASRPTSPTSRSRSRPRSTRR